MLVYDKNPERINDYWCFLSDGTIEKMRICAVGHWSKLNNPHYYRDTDGRGVVAWWDEPRPEQPDNNRLHLTGQNDAPGELA